MDSFEPKNAGTGSGAENPWEQRDSIGFFPALIETSKQVLLKPQEFFSRLTVSPSFKNPFTYYFTITVLTLIVSTTLGILTGKISLPPFSSSVLFAVLLLGALAAGIFLGAGLLHFFIRLWGGSGDFKTSFNIFAYAAATGIPGLIPIIGGIVSYLWNVVIVIIGIKQLHRISTVKATLAYFTPLLIAFLLVIIVSLIRPDMIRL